MQILNRTSLIRGRNNLPLAFDYYIPKLNVVIEFDERQHFTPLRAVSLRAYPYDAILGFDKLRWMQLSEQIRAGDNSPLWRDEQRAFYDAIRDIMVPRIGLRPVIRIFEEDVNWEKSNAS
jgi:very-short-patch-repair endonuclease